MFNAIPSRRAKRITLPFAAVMLSLMPALTVAAPAHAAPAKTVTCYGDYCSGKDPVATGCAEDAVTTANYQEEHGGGIIELRWSNTCKTNWARYTQYPSGWCFTCRIGALRARQEGTDYTQQIELEETPPKEGQSVWTGMIYSPIRGVSAESRPPLTSGSKKDLAFDVLTMTWDSTGAY